MFALANEYRDDAHGTVGRLVNEVHFHGEVITVDRMFAGRVKMELLQLEPAASRQTVTPWIFVLLNRMTVEDQVDFGGFIIEVQPLRRSWDCVANVDR